MFGDGMPEFLIALKTMKHDNLRSIAHNIVDSLASGCGLLIGVYEMDIFREVAMSKEKFMTVDFLSGTTEGATPSTSLADAIKLYSKTLPELCEKQGSLVSDFESLTARFSYDKHGNHVSVTIKDKRGRESTDEYRGIPLKHAKVLDGLGRIRTKRK
jgi:hypothetical protein